MKQRRLFAQLKAEVRASGNARSMRAFNQLIKTFSDWDKIRDKVKKENPKLEIKKSGEDNEREYTLLINGREARISKNPNLSPLENFYKSTNIAPPTGSKGDKPVSEDKGKSSPIESLVELASDQDANYMYMESSGKELMSTYEEDFEDKIQSSSNKKHGDAHVKLLKEASAGMKEFITDEDDFVLASIDYDEDDSDEGKERAKQYQELIEKSKKLGKTYEGIDSIQTVGDYGGKGDKDDLVNVGSVTMAEVDGYKVVLFDGASYPQNGEERVWISKSRK